ncbi:hypothetical protein K144316041_p21200 (plasmid) [Clostridium tetani]|uniref:hypothetical protein n=1 Tax=Clostridium tetani TaxID=1513 RepID=UPI002952D1B1|nr:hypothetical protein [Clostridium tetani]BDR74281.1 hypothetical protein K144316041_p21200 [Clostridium tetani]
MDYISVKEFLKQPKEVQKVLLDWWKPEVGDVYCSLYNNNQPDNVMVINQCQFGLTIFKEDIKKYGIPLLTEGQLRQFIEDETQGKMDILVNGIGITNEYIGYEFMCWSSVDQCKYKKEYSFRVDAKDLLEAYWVVAILIIKGCKNS